MRVRDVSRRDDPGCLCGLKQKLGHTGFSVLKAADLEICAGTEARVEQGSRQRIDQYEA